MKKRKIVSVILTLVFSVVIAGCSADSNNKAAANNDSSESSDINSSSANTSSNKDDDNKEKDSSKNSDSKESKKDENKEADNKEKKSEPSYYGEWSISSTKVAKGQITAYSSDDLKKLSGKKLVFSKEKASAFDDDIKTADKFIKNPQYSEQTIKKDDFYSFYRTDFDTLGLSGDSVKEITVTGNNSMLTCTFLVKDKNTLIIYGGGVFFYLVK